MSYCCASSASVLSLFSAASATCALNAGVWFRLVLLVMLSLLLGPLPQPFNGARLPLILLSEFPAPPLALMEQLLGIDFTPPLQCLRAQPVVVGKGK